MGLHELCIAIFKTALDDLILSKNIEELNKNYAFFREDDFEEWLNLLDNNETYNFIIRKGAKRRYEILKEIFNMCKQLNGVRYRNGKIYVNGCCKKIYFFLENSNVLSYIDNPISKENKFIFKIKWSS